MSMIRGLSLPFCAFTLHDIFFLQAHTPRVILVLCREPFPWVPVIHEDVSANTQRGVSILSGCVHISCVWGCCLSAPQIAQAVFFQFLCSTAVALP